LPFNLKSSRFNEIVTLPMAAAAEKDAFSHCEVTGSGGK
jgi:hypothetical protein